MQSSWWRRKVVVRATPSLIIQPITPDLLPKKIWKYLKLEYFQFLIEKHSLWFSSADTFSDQWEGSYTLADVRMREQLWDEIKNPEEAREGVRAIADWNRMATFVNCWSMNEQECALMWKSFVQGEGIALQSTIERIKRVMPAWVRIVPVRYVNHDEADIPSYHSLQPFTWKQMEFVAERELRLIIDVPPQGHPFRGMRIVPKGHRLVDVDLETLIESIVVAPASSAATTEAARRFLANAGLDKPVLASRLSRLPYH
jgi:hypothetical protein